MNIKMKNSKINKIMKVALLFFLIFSCRHYYSLDDLNVSPKLVVNCLSSPQQDTTFIEEALRVTLQQCPLPPPLTVCCDSVATFRDGFLRFLALSKRKPTKNLAISENSSNFAPAFCGLCAQKPNIMFNNLIFKNKKA